MCRIFFITILFASIILSGVSSSPYIHKEAHFVSLLHHENITDVLTKVYTDIYYNNGLITINSKVDTPLLRNTTSHDLAKISFTYNYTNYSVGAVTNNVNFIKDEIFYDRRMPNRLLKHSLYTDIFNIALREECLPSVFDIIYNKIPTKFENNEKDLFLFLLSGLISNIAMYFPEMNNLIEYNIIETRLKSLGYFFIKYRKENID